MYSRTFERQATIMARSTKWSDIGHSNARKKAPLWHTAYEVIFMAVSHRGAISFGLVHIPVGLYTATQDNDIHFNQLCKDDHSRVRYKKVCASCGKEVKNTDIVKGFEYDDGKYVVVTDEDFEKIKTEKDKSIQIMQFVDLSTIRPLSLIHI